MDVIADGMLFLAALSAAAYCAILSKRLRKLTNTDGALNGAISKLNAEVEELRSALAEAKRATESAAGDLDLRVTRALAASSSLESLTAAADSAAAAAETAAARAEEASVSARSEVDATTASAERLERANGAAAALADRLDASAERAEMTMTSPVDDDAASELVDQPVAPADPAPDEGAFAGEATPSIADAVDPGAEDEAGGASTQSQIAALLAIRDGDEDDVFANRLVDALSNLDQKPVAEGAPQ